MTRPRKNNVDYFPHDCTSGKTLAILEQRYKNDGYACWFKTLELLGNTENHYYDCADNFNWEYIKTKTLIDDDDRLIKIIDLMASVGAIDKTLWNEHKVLWSDNFISRIADVYKKRTTETPIKPSFRTENPIETPQSGNGNPQRKVKESKGKRKESKDGAVQKTNRKTSTPKTFPVTDEMKAYAKSKGYKNNLADLTEPFLQYHRKQGSKFVCWYSAWQTWLRNEIKFNGIGKSSLKQNGKGPDGEICGGCDNWIDTHCMYQKGKKKDDQACQQFKPVVK